LKIELDVSVVKRSEKGEEPLPEQLADDQQ